MPSTLFLIRLVNNIVATMIGLPAGCLLFYLIINKSPEHLKSYKQLLMFGAITDTYLLLQNFLLQIRLTTSNGVFITFMGPFAYLFGNNAFCTFFMFNSIAQQIAIAVLPIQCFYRFYTLSRKKSPTLLQTGIRFILLLSISAGPIYYFMITFCPGNNVQTQIVYDVLLQDEIEVLINSPDPGGFLKQYSATLTLIIYYIISLWYAYRTMREMKRRVSSLSYTAKSTQAQLGRTLFVQALIPFSTQILPRFAFIAVSYAGLSLKYAGDITSSVVIWFPSLNLFSTIICIVPYRRFCLCFIPYYSAQKRITNVTVLSSVQNGLPNNTPI